MYSDKVSPMTPDEAMGFDWASPAALLDRMTGNPPEVLKSDGVKFLQAQGLMVGQIAKAFGISVQRVMEIRNKHDWRERKPTGRKTPVTEEKLEAIRQARAAGKKLDEIKDELHVGMSTIYKALGKPVAVLETKQELETAEITALAEPEPTVLETLEPILETVKGVIISEPGPLSEAKPEPIYPATISATKYKPLASLEIMNKSLDVMEEMLSCLDSDVKVALGDGDYSVAVDMIKQMQAVSLSIDLLVAEIGRCK